MIDLYDHITQDRLGVCQRLCSPFDRQVHTGTASIPLEELKGEGAAVYKEVTIEQKKKRKEANSPVVKISTQMLSIDGIKTSIFPLLNVLRPLC